MEGSSLYTIEFNGKGYLLRDILYKDDFFVEDAIVTIGTVGLNKALFTSEDMSQYVSKEAKQIDDRIIFFVDDDEINESEEYLRNLLRRNIA